MHDPLAELRHHWSGAYEIINPAPDVYVAIRADGRRSLKADTPGGLREAIRADYAAEPVPRPR